jgi:hypothetical protein
MFNECKVAIRPTLSKRPHHSVPQQQTPLPRDSIHIEGCAPEAAPNDVPAAPNDLMSVTSFVACSAPNIAYGLM